MVVYFVFATSLAMWYVAFQQKWCRFPLFPCNPAGGNDVSSFCDRLCKAELVILDERAARAGLTRCYASSSMHMTEWPTAFYMQALVLLKLGHAQWWSCLRIEEAELAWLDRLGVGFSICKSNLLDVSSARVRHSLGCRQWGSGRQLLTVVYKIITRTIRYLQLSEYEFSYLWVVNYWPCKRICAMTLLVRKNANLYWNVY